MQLGQFKTKTDVWLYSRCSVSRRFANKLAARQILFGVFYVGVLFFTLMLAACVPSKKPPSLSITSVSPSSDLVIGRLTTTPNVQSTIDGSSTVNENNGVSVSSDINTVNTTQQNPTADVLNDSQNKVANSVIDTIIWQIQTGPAPQLPVDPILPEGEDPSLTEDALEAAGAPRGEHGGGAARRRGQGRDGDGGAG